MIFTTEIVAFGQWRGVALGDDGVEVYFRTDICDTRQDALGKLAGINRRIEANKGEFFLPSGFKRL